MPDKNWKLLIALNISTDRNLHHYFLLMFIIWKENISLKAVCFFNVYLPIESFRPIECPKILNFEIFIPKI